ncbi:MAG: sulfotransferase [Betaproteobacteria bacterium]|nr:sulfotransferase [Betaproteobacteria bacterium]
MRKRVYLSDDQISGTSDTIFITGSPRSGTTLVGKYVGSFDRVEYHFEPPLLYMITAMVTAGAIDRESATDILRAYLYEDLLVESVHGRKVNLRAKDDSCVLNMISWEELNRRWRDISNRKDAIDEIANKRLQLAVKMPGIADSIRFLKEGFADSRIIIVLRDGRPVVRSILRKGWLNDESLFREYWPYKTGACGQVRVPYFVEDRELDRWYAMNGATRACYMWRKDAEAALDVMGDSASKPNTIAIRYEDILRDPLKEVTNLAATLKQAFTDQTYSLIRDTITPPSMSRDVDQESFFADVDRSELDKFLFVNQQLGYR